MKEMNPEQQQRTEMTDYKIGDLLIANQSADEAFCDSYKYTQVRYVRYVLDLFAVLGCEDEWAQGDVFLIKNVQGEKITIEAAWHDSVRILHKSTADLCFSHITAFRQNQPTQGEK